MNLPNKLSCLRIALIPVFIALFYWNFPCHYWAAAAVFVLSAMTDFLDGKIARKYNLVTDLGKFLDTCADKVLVLSALVVICDGRLLPEILAGVGISVIIAREILVSCLRMTAASANSSSGEGSDASQRVIAADMFGKIKTFLQDVTIVAILVAAAVGETFGAEKAGRALWLVGVVLFCLSIAATIISGVHYFIKHKDVLKNAGKSNK